MASHVIASCVAEDMFSSVVAVYAEIVCFFWYVSWMNALLLKLACDVREMSTFGEGLCPRTFLCFSVLERPRFLEPRCYRLPVRKHLFLSL